MWWRVLGAALALLAVGAVGGYALADHNVAEPGHGTALEPVPAVSPAVPTPPAQELLTDPSYPALEPGVPAEQIPLRPRRRDRGLAVDVPTGWLRNRQDDSNIWTFTPSSIKNTYGLRVNLLTGQNISVPAAIASRVIQLQQAEDDGNLEDFEITAQTADTLEATYVDGGYLRVTMEKWTTLGGSTAYAVAAVTGRRVDEEGLRDLLASTVGSMEELPPEP